MKTEIYYFTGTGNTLDIARGLQKELGNADIISINKIMINNEEINSDADVIGIVTPVYFLNLPECVKKFIEKMKIKNSAYIFCIVNCGVMEGNIIYKTKKLFAKKGLELSYGNTVYMPDNSIVYYLGEEKNLELLQKKDKVIVEISKDIADRKITKFKNILGMDIMSKISTTYMNAFLNIGRKKCDETICTKCERCIKVCPTSNIKMENSFPKWGSRCEECFACINWCPNNAVVFGKLKADNKKCINPNVTVKDIEQQK